MTVVQREPIGGPASRLSDEQRAVVEAPLDPAIRVLAGPGSGKTTLITHRYAYLLRCGVRPDQIVAWRGTRADGAAALLARLCARPLL